MNSENNSSFKLFLKKYKFLFLIILTIVYFISREHLVFLFILSSGILVIIFYFWNKLELFNNSKFLNKLVIIVTLLYLILSTFNYRYRSSDGFYFTIRYMNALMDKWYINSTDFPIKVYFGELIFTTINKFFGTLTLNFFLGILFLLASFLTYKFFSKTIVEKKKAILAFLIFLFSPTFLAFGFIELKVDLLCYILILLSLILIYFKTNKDAKFQKYSLFVPFLLGTACIIKSSTITICLPILFFNLYLEFVKDSYLSSKIKFFSFNILIFILPICIWYLNFGGTIPQFENYIKLSSNKNQVSVQLERDLEIYKNCMAERINADYSNFVYGANSYLVLFQPFFYIFNYNSVNQIAGQPMANPGILIYLGLILSIFDPFTKKFQKRDLYNKGLSLITSVSTIIFLIYAGSIYWYVLPLFPIYTLRFVEFIYDGFVKVRYLYLLLSIIFVTNIFYVLIYSYFLGEPIYFYENKKIDLKISEITGSSLILDASEHPDFAGITFIKDWDTKIVKSSYYFVSSKKDFESITKELKSKNILYILTNPQQFDSTLIKGCPLENNKILKEYLKHKATKVGLNNQENYKMLYKIN